jgi:beta-glucosidase
MSLRPSRPLPSLCALAVLACTALTLTAQAPHIPTDAEKARVESLIQKMTPEEKIDYIGGTGFAIRAVPSLNLPALEMSDGPYGTRSNSGFPSTTYAAGIGLAATWDRDLAQQVGSGIGQDARARGVHFMLGPGVNIYRSPRNGRNFEYFGEDPFLSGQIAVGYIDGIQSQGVSATVKHFDANNSEYLRHDSDSIVDERTLREIYLPAFEMAVTKAHVGAVMDSYNLINGEHATANSHLNIDILRNDWHFPYTLMSDWVATYSATGAANGGLDLEMPNGAFMNRANLLAALANGTVKQSTIDEKVRHILLTASAFGWLDPNHQQRDTSISVVSGRSNAIALQSARESLTLLKNTGNLLPLDRSKIKSILVVGPDAYPGVAVGGGSAGVVPFTLVGPLAGMQRIAGDTVNILYDAGLPTLSELARRTSFVTAPTGGKPGVTIDTFPSLDLSGTPKQTSARNIDITGIGWDAISGSLDDLMAALMSGQNRDASRRITGYLDVPSAATYLLALTTGGEGNGLRVFIDDKPVIDDWKYVRAFEPHLSLPLSAGMHKVVVETWQNGLIGGKVRLALVPEDSVVNASAKTLAAQADVVLVAAGYQSNADNESEGEGGDRTFDLPFGQDALIRSMTSANPRTIVSITSGGNVDSSTWIDKVPALIEAWYGGQSGGQALAEAIFGDINPSGHLPATFERREQDNPTYNNYYPQDGGIRVLYKEGIFVGYRGYQKEKIAPLFPFGYGLSYTTFAFSNLKLSPATDSANVTVTFDITNTGSRKGVDVAQVYVGDDHAKVPRPIRELKGFSRVDLAPNETRHISISLDPRSFAYYDVSKKKWTIDPGKFTIEAGDSVESLPLHETLQLSKEAATAF